MVLSGFRRPEPLTIGGFCLRGWVLTLFAAAAVPVIGVLAPAAPARADGGYIAIAGSDSTRSVETTTGGSLASLDHVEDYAVNHCAARRGATDCRILAAGVGGCVALSDDGHNLVGAWGATRSAAGAAAVAKAGRAGATVDIVECFGDPGLGGSSASGGTSFWSQ